VRASGARAFQSPAQHTSHFTSEADSAARAHSQDALRLSWRPFTGLVLLSAGFGLCLQTLTAPLALAATQTNASVSGVLTDKVTGTAISGATVRLEQGSTIKYTFKYTAGDGAYSISNVIPGTYRVVGLCSGYQNWFQDFAFASGQHRTVNMSMCPSTARISGTVRDAYTGQPVAGATVRLEQGSTIVYTFKYTVGDGYYHIEGVAPGTYRLVALESNHQNSFYDVTLAACDNSTGANLSMVPLSSISGVMTDAVTGQPISGGTVRLEQGSSIIYEFKYTGADGAYSINGVQPGTYRVVGLELSEHLNWFQDYTFNAGQHLNVNIVMTPTTARISGVVRNNLTGQPIADATVRLEQGSTIVYTFRYTASDGYYHFEGVAPGTYRLVALQSDFQNTFYDVVLNAGSNITGSDLNMPPLASISGVMIDKVTRQPVSGGTVRLEQGGTIVTEFKYTGADGAYSISGVQPGVYRVTGLQLNDYQNWFQDYTFNPGAHLAVNLEMVPLTARISGTVLDKATGQPIADATVRLEQGSDIIYTFKYTTSDGTYHFEGVAPGTYRLVALQLEQYVNRFYDVSLVAGGNVAGANLDMDHLPGLTGHVVDDVTGVPVAGATVRLHLDGATPYEAVTDESGSYVFSNVLTATYTMDCLKLDTHQNWGPESITLGANDRKIVDIRLVPLAAISGVVKDRNSGAPVADATVRLEQGSAIRYTFSYTSADGRYSISGVQPGTYRVVALQIDHQNAFVDRSLDPGSHVSLDLTMTPTLASISGVVRDNGSRAPLADATVRLEQGTAIKYTFKYTGATGAYAFSGILPGTYNLVGLHPTDYSNKAQQITINAGDVSTGLDIDMVSTTARIHGRVFDAATGAPVVGATVRLEQGSTIVYTFKYTDGDGAYSFSSVNPGAYRLVGLELTNYLNTSINQQLDAGAYLAIDVPMRSLAARWSGAVRDAATGNPIAGATAQLRQGLDVLKEVVVGGDGAFVFSGLTAGTYSVLARKTGSHNDATITRTFADGEAVSGLDVSLTAIGGGGGPQSISGVVRDKTMHSALVGATVTLYRGTSTVTSMATNSLGVYSFANPAAADYTVGASASGHAEASSGLVAYRGVSMIADLDMEPLTVSEGPRLPDLTLAGSDVRCSISADGQSFDLTAFIHNRGNAPASQVRVRFYDVTGGVNQASPIGSDQIIGSLGVGAMSAVGVNWRAPSGHEQVYVFVDPGQAIAELDELNNAVQYQVMRRPPHVANVSAKYDGNRSAGVIGTFTTGITGAVNRFYADVTPLDGVVKRVRFDFDGVMLEDADGGDGWAVNFDVGRLRAGNRPLQVTAYDDAGIASQPYTVTLAVRDWPAWMRGHVRLGDAPVSFGIANGYMVCDLDVYNESSPGNHLLEFNDVIAPDVMILGSKRSAFDLSGAIELQIPLDDALPWKASGSVTRSETVFDHDFGEEAVNFALEISRDGNTIQSVTLGASGSVNALHTPEATAPPFLVYGVRIQVGVSMDVFLRAGLSVTLANNLNSISASLEPSVTADVHGMLHISDPLKFAEVELVLAPSLTLSPRIQYSAPPSHLTVAGQFSWEVRGDIWGSLFWGWARKDLYSWTWGPWSRDFGANGTMTAGGWNMREIPVNAAAQLPQLFPYPSMATTPDGRAGLVWIDDVDASTDRVDPEVFYAEVGPGGDWGAASRVTQNARFETSPKLAFLPGDSALAVWTQNSLLESDADAGLSLSAILAHQDIWSSTRSSGGAWSDPLPVCVDSLGVLRGDGRVALGTTRHGAVAVWTRASMDSVLANGSSDVYAAVFDGTTWGPVTPLSTEWGDDTGPAVSGSGGDSSTVLWLRDDGLQQGRRQLFWTSWDGSRWDAPRPVTGWLGEHLDPSVTQASNGLIVSTWVERETRADSTVRYHLWTSAKAPLDTTWAEPREVFADSSFIETPIVLADTKSRVLALWRGYDGMDGDLMVSIRDMSDAGGNWTTPRAVGSDSLTDWMVAGGFDRNGELQVVDMKTNLADSAANLGAGTFFRGMTLTRRQISSTLQLGEGLTRGTRPSKCDLAIPDGGLYADRELATAGHAVGLGLEIANLGDIASQATRATIFDGAPDSGGVVVDSTLAVPALPADSRTTLSTNWIASGGRHRLYAVLDPDHRIDELGRANNTRFVTVRCAPDLIVDSLVCSDPNPTPSESLLVTAYLHNRGGAIASGYLVRLARNGSPAASAEGPILNAGASAPVTFPYLASVGMDSLLVVTDPDSLTDDLDRTNDSFHWTLAVGPDLGVAQDSIAYVWTPGDSTGTLQFRLSNLGRLSAGPFDVLVYRGDPRLGGTKLDSLRLPGLEQGAVLTIARPLFSGLGSQRIFVSVDPAAAVLDRNPDNNLGFVDFERGGLADLTVGPVRFDPSSPSGGILHVPIVNIGDAAGIAVPVEVFRGRPEAGGVEVESRLMLVVGTADTISLDIPWTRSSLAPDTVLVCIDRAGGVLDKNRANNEVQVILPPSLGVDDLKVAIQFLGAPMPNPFTHGTAVTFGLPVPWHVRLEIFDLAGSRVRSLIDREMAAGVHTVTWDGRSDAGFGVPAGIYFLRFSGPRSSMRRKLVHLN
jgi:5-hydroxyisourate hydrolase-like protein (transthyretin family)